MVTASISPKSRLANSLLAWFLGGLGVDRFYLGKIGTGILKLITAGGFGIWWLIDLIMALTGASKDKDGLPIKNW
jgi:TM2 domain-containing membrane protein YozV